MKVKDIQPVISSIIVIIDGLRYKNTLCTIEVTCNTADNSGSKWHATTASCEEPYFIMGSSFWQENFGVGQTNRIKELCDKAVKDYLKDE